MVEVRGKNVVFKVVLNLELKVGRVGYIKSRLIKIVVGIIKKVGWFVYGICLIGYCLCCFVIIVVGLYFNCDWNLFFGIRVLFKGSSL